MGYMIPSLLFFSPCFSFYPFIIHQIKVSKLVKGMSFLFLSTHYKQLNQRQARQYKSSVVILPLEGVINPHMMSVKEREENICSPIKLHARMNAFYV